MDSHAGQTIVVKKVIKGHGGHHGGAWKVAYADFVTAMMALFIVLWLMNANAETRQAVAGYFKDVNGQAGKMGTGAAGIGDGVTLRQGDLSKLKDKIEGVMRSLPNLSTKMQKQVQMTVTGEGLRIELLETDTGLFFETGSAQPTESGKGLLAALSSELKKLQNPILVEGHTDAKPFTNGNAYSNWELSTDRANAARRTIEAAGLPPGRIRQVRGFADQRLRLPNEPLNASNRRVSVVVEYAGPLPNPDGAPAPHESKPAAESPSKH